MPNSEFGERAKALSQALLADRAVTVLNTASTKTLAPGPSEARRTLERAKELLDSSISGLSSLKGEESRTETEELGFLSWMESLSAYRTTFAAMVKGNMVTQAEDAEKILFQAHSEIKDVLDGKKAKKRSMAATLLENFAEICSEESVADAAPVERLPSPAFVGA